MSKENLEEAESFRNLGQNMTADGIMGSEVSHKVEYGAISPGCN